MPYATRLNLALGGAAGADADEDEQLAVQPLGAPVDTELTDLAFVFIFSYFCSFE